MGLKSGRAMLAPGRFLLALLVVACATRTAFADTTTVSGSDASVTTGTAPVTVQIPLTRAGDLSGDTVVKYHTVDGSAQAGVDYESAKGYLVIPAGATSATVPVVANPLGGGGSGGVSFGLDFSAIGVGPQPDFGAAPTFTAGNGPSRVIVVDLNGDGRPEMASVNSIDGDVSVFVNASAPGATAAFSAQQRFGAGSSAAALAATDINGDGRADLVVANGGSGAVTVLLNTTAAGAATASFAVAQSYPLPDMPASIAAGDLNGDGKPDLVMGAPQLGSVMVLLNTTPTGTASVTYSPPGLFAADTGAGSVAIADIDGDGRRDLVVGNAGTTTLSVFFNTTAPGATLPAFAARQAIDVGDKPEFVAAGDLNGDGRPDLAVASVSGNFTTVLFNTTLPASAVAAFAAMPPFTTGTSPSYVAIADLNGDGRPDLAVAAAAGPAVWTLLNRTVPGDSDGAFSAASAHAGGGTNAAAVAVADMNADGVADLVVGDLASPAVSVIEGTAPATITAVDFTAPTTAAAGTLPIDVDIADMNGDGKPDVVAADLLGNVVSVLLNGTAPAAAVPALSTAQTFATGAGPRGVAIADLNGDGKPDILTANEAGNTVSIVFNTTTAASATLSFSSHADLPVGDFPFAVTAADFNGDGLPEIAVANAHDNTVTVAGNSVPPGSTVPGFQVSATLATGAAPSSVVAVDVNGDGLRDLVVADWSVGTVDVLLNTTVPGATDASFAARQPFAVGSGPEWADAIDVNNDGLPDIVSANSIDNTFSVLLNATSPGSASLAFGAPQVFASGTQPCHVTGADLDGDGRIDLVVTSQGNASASLFINQTMPGASTVAFASGQDHAIGAQGVMSAIGDLNGDGKPDLVSPDIGGELLLSVSMNTQYLVVHGAPATGTIVHDLVFADGFD